jgi:iron(III) transport system ATP-binding protein
MIKIEHLRKEYAATGARFAAVRDLSFEIARGEVFVLLGPSGCGKSTTLRCVAGLEVPDGGTIWLDGRPVYAGEQGGTLVPTEQREVGMVFQSYAVWPHMTVLENVVFPLTDGRTRLPKTEAIRRAREALRLVRLDGLENRPATQLSGGQQQRVALARAVATEPKVLLMDEPLSNLDAALREQMRAELRPLFADLGLTVLYVTHVQAEALSVATRIGVMANGELIQIGAPEDVYERPARQMVMAFLGGSNFVPGEVTGRGEAQTPLGAVQAAALQDYPVGSTVVLGLRPEDVVLVQQAPTNGAHVLPGTVTKRLFVGEAVLLEILVHGIVLQARTSRHTRAAVGDSVGVALPPDQWKVMPA